MLVNDQEDIVKLFVAKYGSEDSQKNQLLQKSISKIIQANDHETLTKLKAKLSKTQSQQIFPQISEQRDTLTAVNQGVAKRIQPFQKTYIKSFDQISEYSEKPPKSVYFVDRQDEDEWAALMKFDAQLYQKEQERKKELIQQKKAQMKLELDTQLKIKQERKRKEKELEEKYNIFQSDLLTQQNQNEQQKMLRNQNKLIQLQTERDEQLQHKKRRQQSENKELRSYKKEISARYEDELKKQQEEENRVKTLKKEYMFKVMKQSEADKLMILQKQKEQDKIEQENCDKYGQLLDQIEHRRLEENRVKKEKVDKNNAWSESQLHKFKLEKEDDEKLKHWQAYEEQKFLEEEQKKQRRINELKSKTIQSLEQSIKLKSLKKNEEKELDNLQGKIWKEDTERYFKEEQAKLEQIKSIKVQHKQILQQQMQQKIKPGRGEKMSIPELLQNKNLLKTIKEENNSLRILNQSNKYIQYLFFPMSSNIELVPFYTSLLRTIQNMFQAKLINEEQRSRLKNFVVTHETSELGPLFKSYENGRLEQYILETFFKEENQQISGEVDDDSCDSFSDIECQKSTLSCTPNLFVCQLKQSQQLQQKETIRKRSCSFTGEKDK